MNIACEQHIVIAYGAPNFAIANNVERSLLDSQYFIMLSTARDRIDFQSYA